jgi:TRAP-type C4-dicarboxylate transport system permease small subunit
MPGAFQWLYRFNTGLLWLCRQATIGLVGAIALVVVLGVFFRYVLNDSLSWTEETAKFLMVWLVFAGSPIALRHGGHAAIDTLPNLMPPRLKQIVLLLAYTVVLALMAVLVYQGTTFSWNARVQETSTTQISMLYIFGAMPLGSAIMFLVGLELWLQALAGIWNPQRGLAADNLELARISGE